MNVHFTSKNCRRTKAHYEETSFPMDTVQHSADIPAGFIDKENEVIFAFKTMNFN